MVSNPEFSDEVPPTVPSEASSQEPAGSSQEPAEPSPEPKPEVYWDAPADSADSLTRSPRNPRNPRTVFVVGVLLFVLLAAIGWFAWARQAATGTTPQSAVTAMMDAYATYDAKAILDTVTHDKLTADDIKRFTSQAASSKKAAGGKPAVKGVSIGKVKTSGSGSATVEVTAQWLDPTKGTYEKSTETLPVVRKGGKWLVQLF